MMAAADARSQARALAARLAAHLRRAGGGLIAVPGGTTPAPLFDALARRDAGWRNVVVTLTDERWVAAWRPASNERLVRRRLLQAQARAARFIPLKTPHSTPHAAIALLSRRLRAAGPPEICLLGMGEDGHVASLFPGAPHGRAMVQAADVEGAAGASARISLSLRTILAARLIVIFIRGREKLAALRRWLAPGAPETPVRALVRARRGPLWLSWSP